MPRTPSPARLHREQALHGCAAAPKLVDVPSRRARSVVAIDARPTPLVLRRAARGGCVTAGTRCRVAVLVGAVARAGASARVGDR